MNDGRVEKHIGVLDGIRAMSIVMVVWFHFWQQTWLTPYITFDNNLTKYLGITGIKLADYVRYGFIFVDMLVLLSAFCNFYPYARAITLGENWPNTSEFYFKRAARIIPSYLLSIVIILFIFALPEKQYATCTFMWKDIITYLTFTGGFWTDTFKETKLNGVLWTVQLEVMFYILIPWLARLFRRVPVMIYNVMMLVNIISVNYIIYHYPRAENLYVNHMLTFTGVYANGILLSILFVIWKKNVVENRYTRLAATVLAVCCIIGLRGIIEAYGLVENLSEIQLRIRLPQSFLFSGFIFLLPMLLGGGRLFFQIV